MATTTAEKNSFPEIDKRDQLIDAVIAHVPFDGWSTTALKAGASDIGVPISEARALFPSGARDMIAWHSNLGDRRMLAALEKMDMPSLKIRERIATAVMTRLRQNAPAREAIRRALSSLAMPQNAPMSLRLLYKTVDAMWYAAGDTATDWNFYTKRGLLSGVYSSTLMVWLNDDSENFAVTEAFLNRRIADVMKVPKLTARVSKIGAAVPKRLKSLRRFAPRKPGRGFRTV